MKNNQPVTQREVPVDSGEILLSTTTPRGVITYSNPVFQRIAGFTNEELVGEAHNIVRHPDMPRLAFADLWNTVGKGRPWFGIVKNRCKSGDHYWVDAYVTPILDPHGNVVEHQSVRIRAEREIIERAEKVYRELGQSMDAAPPERCLPPARGLLERQRRALFVVLLGAVLPAVLPFPAIVNAIIG
ncbi:MAG: PAS domain-containing protein, partial [Planctomycetes bacterium]|nr:PAS domain-containing protein [Planctomycetota bacterium]